MGDIVIEELNYKAIIFSLINAAIFLSAISLAIYGFDHDSVGFWLSGLTISIIVSFFLIGSLLKAVKIKKLLTITRDGIIDNSSISGVGYISFDDIKEFKIVTIYNKKAIAVIPKNIENFMSELNMVKRRFIKRNLNLELPPVAIFVNRAKDIAPEDILSLLQKRLADITSLDS
jgi:hypothetical protein